MVWLKIWKHDIPYLIHRIDKDSCGLIKDLKTRYSIIVIMQRLHVVVWLKIWKHDILPHTQEPTFIVVVWLKIWKHDIKLISLL